MPEVCGPRVPRRAILARLRRAFDVARQRRGHGANAGHDGRDVSLRRRAGTLRKQASMGTSSTRDRRGRLRSANGDQRLVDPANRALSVRARRSKPPYLQRGGRPCPAPRAGAEHCSAVSGRAPARPAHLERARSHRMDRIRTCRTRRSSRRRTGVDEIACSLQ